MKKETILRNSLSRGVLIRKNDLISLRPILTQWTEKIIEYCNCFPGQRGDAPYRHDERVIASTLTCAICGVGGVALGEYPAKKGNHSGRVDIWFQWRGENYVIEVKKAKMHVEKEYSANTFLSKIDKEFVRLRTDFTKLRKPKGRFLGAVFAIPSMFDEGEQNTYELLQVFQSALIEGKHDLLAWVFPKSARTLKYYKIYPGVGLNIMEIDKNQ